ncbi:MAG: hypothetical protein O3C28_02530 [Proteobacteria bacterium]|nr:hypothetical protein [Pseudomonadota bacterium]
MTEFPRVATDRLPRWLWLWFPPILLLVIIPIKIMAPEFYRSFIDGELGLIELATPVISIIGAIIGFKLMRIASALPSVRIRIWMLLTTLGCVYLAGEELSWGQHLVGWRTPVYLEALNDQEETNLHNISSWFDQKPRLLLEIWVLVGGVVWPLRELIGKSHRAAIGTESYWFWPSIELLPTALLAILIRLPERIKSLFDIAQLPLELRFSEPQEYYFALFLAIYLGSVYKRMKSHNN